MMEKRVHFVAATIRIAKHKIPLKSMGPLLEVCISSDCTHGSCGATVVPRNRAIDE